MNTVSAIAYPVTTQPQIPDTEVVPPKLTTVGVNPTAKTRRRRSKKGDAEATSSCFETWCFCFVCCTENESNCCDGCNDCDLSGLFS